MRTQHRVPPRHRLPDLRIADGLRVRLDAANARVDRIDALLETGDPTAARGELARLEEDRTEIARQAVRYATQVCADAGKLAAALQQVPPGPVANVSLSATQLAQMVNPSADAGLPDALRAAHRAEVDRAGLTARLRTAVELAISKVPPNQRAAAQAAAEPLLDLLGDAGSLADVADGLPAFVAGLKQAGIALGAAGDVVVAETQREPVRRPARTRLDRPAEQVPPTSRRFVAAGLAAGSEAARLVLLVAVISALAYGVFGSDWIGTFAQMVAVFSWAFAIDVSIEAVRSVLPAAPQTP